MLTLLLTASSAFCSLAQQSSSVDPRWRLIGDNALVPVRDLINIAASRLYLEDRAKSYKEEAIMRAKETLALREAVKNKDKEVGIANGQVERCRGELSTMDDMLEKCEGQNDKLRPWATVGRVGTITVSLAVVGLVAERIINSAKP